VNGSAQLCSAYGDVLSRGASNRHQLAAKQEWLCLDSRIETRECKQVQFRVHHGPWAMASQNRDGDGHGLTGPQDRWVGLLSSQLNSSGLFGYVPSATLELNISAQEVNGCAKLKHDFLFQEERLRQLSETPQSLITPCSIFRPSFMEMVKSTVRRLSSQTSLVAQKLWSNSLFFFF